MKTKKTQCDFLQKKKVMMTVMPHSSVRQTNRMKRELKFHVLSVQCDNILMDKND